MEKLEYGKKGTGDKLTAEEWNKIPAKIDEVIDALLVTGETEGTAFDGGVGSQLQTTVGSQQEMLAQLQEMVSQLTGGQTLYSVYVKNNLDGKSISTQKGESCKLNFTFISKEKAVEDTDYSATGETGSCQVSVKNSKYDTYTVVKIFQVMSVSEYELDVAEWLTSGANQVMVKVTGDVTENTTSALVYTVQLTSLSLNAENFAWWTGYKNDIQVPVYIGGNIAKTMYVTLTGNGYSQSYQVEIGTAVYTETAYNYTLKHPGVSGVYELDMYVTNSDGTIRTKTVSLQIMCVVAGDTVKLMAVNNVLSKARNWSENSLFDYAIYDGDATTSSATFAVTKDGASIYSSEDTAIPAQERQSFKTTLEVETLDDTEFSIVLTAMDGETALMDAVTMAVNNSEGYSSTAGAVLYIDPRKRSNTQGNYLSVVNEADNSVVECTQTNMSWKSDGWVTDGNGNKVRRQLANSILTVGYYPFAKECARVGKTIEVKIKPYNVSDYSVPYFICGGDVNGKFVGVRVYPDKIEAYSQSKQDSDNQSYPLDDGQILDLALSIVPNTYGNVDYNTVYIYVRGRKCHAFNYESNDYFKIEGTSAPIVIGCSGCDVDLYGLRVYDKGLSSSALMKNYINWQLSTDAKSSVKSDNELLDADGTLPDFLKIKSVKNVWTMDVELPNKLNPGDVKGTLKVYYADHAEWNVTISNVKAAGQGSTSKGYYEWNIKFSLTDSSVITYADGTQKTGKWDMYPNKVPAGKKFTAKLNWASMSQDHKMGSVNLVTDLYKQVGLSNEAMDDDSLARVSVMQDAFVGFTEVVNEEGKTVYTYKGNYTFGPDKGDKYCFGYDTSKYAGLISMEMSDNGPLPCSFLVPWSVSRMVYDEDAEGWLYNGVQCNDFDGGSIDNVAAWINAYNLVHSCAVRFMPFDGTLNELNAAVETYRATGYLYWIAKSGDANYGNLYYYEAGDGKFVGDDIGGGTINLLTQLVDNGYGLATDDLAGKTADELNVLLVTARVQRAAQKFPDVWHKEDSLFHLCWVELTGGSDQRNKNTYPYCFGLETSKWRWRYDDMDTIWATNNQGLLTKKYSAEVGDKYANGQPVWNGENNQMWNVMEAAFGADKSAMMKKMLDGMQTLGGATSGTALDKVYACYEKYYVNIKDYFPAVLVNEMGKHFENAELLYKAGTYTNDTEPITQIVGDAYSPDTSFVRKRLIYLFSKYMYGIFAAKASGAITMRAAGNTISYTITPAMDIYPCVANGESVVRGERTMAGNACTITIDLGGASDQQNSILGADYLSDIGDWHDKNVTGNMSVTGKMLKKLTLGSKTADIVISITGLTVAGCDAMEEIVLSRISTLSGILDVSSMTRLKTLSADGTSLSQLKLAEGGALEIVEYPDTNQYLILKNLPMLTEDGVIMNGSTATITDFFVSDCVRLNPIDLLIQIMEGQSGQSAHALKRVRAVGFDETYDTGGSAMLDNLGKLADGSYEGLNASGLAGDDEYPVLDGTLNVNANCYEDTVTALRGKFTRLVLNITGNYYIRFADDAVRAICASNWGDGTGITLAQAEAVSSIGTKFNNNETIVHFDELNIFKNVTSLDNNAFEWSTKLETVNLENITSNKIPNRCFCECHTLKSFDMSNITYIGGSGFYNCYSLTGIISLPNVTEIWNFAFSKCTGLTGIDIGIYCTKVQYASLSEMPNLKFVICRATIPPSSTGVPLHSSNKAIVYVPDDSVDAYKSADGWNEYADNIRGLSEYVES